MEIWSLDHDGEGVVVWGVRMAREERDEAVICDL